ncbi:unnamed protein product [Musa banksii]
MSATAIVERSTNPNLLVWASFTFDPSGNPPAISSAGDLICLRSDRVYTVGRRRRHCDLVLLHRCISNRHCQIFLDGSDRKLRLIDGFLFPRRSHIREIRRGFQAVRQCSNARVFLNGV